MNPNVIPVKNPYPERSGRTYQNKDIALIANYNKSIELNTIQDKLYRWSAAIIEYSFKKRPLKEILPIAKEIYRIGQPQINYNVNVLMQGNIGDLEKLYSHLMSIDHKVDNKAEVIDITPGQEALPSTKKGSLP